MFNLRASLIRLAHAHPEFRADLLPVIKQAMEFDTQKQLDEYKKTHDVRPGTKLKVKKQAPGGSTPAKQDKKPADKKDTKEKETSKVKPANIGGKEYKALDLASNRHHIFDAVDKEYGDATGAAKYQDGASAPASLNKARQKVYEVLDEIKDLGKGWDRKTNGWDGEGEADDVALRKLNKAYAAFQQEVEAYKKKDTKKPSAPKEDKPKKKEAPDVNSKEMGNMMRGWAAGDDIMSQVGKLMTKGETVSNVDLQKALRHVDKLLKEPDFSPQGKSQLQSIQKALTKAVEPKKAPTKKEAPAKEKSYAKKYHKTVETVMDKHNLTDDDADQVKAWKKDKPFKGKPITDAEKLRRFLAKAKPETKERMKGVSPAEFMKMLGVIFDDEEGAGGKAASLRSRIIRLAYARPDLRAGLLALV